MPPCTQCENEILTVIVRVDLLAEFRADRQAMLGVNCRLKFPDEIGHFRFSLPQLGTLRDFKVHSGKRKPKKNEKCLQSPVVTYLGSVCSTPRRHQPQLVV